MLNSKKILIIEKFTGLECVQNHLDNGDYGNVSLLELEKFHNEHVTTRAVLQKLFEKSNLEYNLVKVDLINGLSLENYDFVVSLGGDGTFLEAAKHITKQILIGVNSEVDRSVGYLTSFNISNLDEITKQILKQNINLENWERISVRINGQNTSFLALNEVFIGHPKIYKTSHLLVSAGEKKSYFSGNGLVVSTFKGSTAFYKSGGGQGFEAGNFGFASLLNYRAVGNLEKDMVLDGNSVLQISPKRLGQSIIFDGDEGREIILNQDDLVEVCLDANNFLKVMILV